MPTEKMTFEGHEGSILAGRLDLPEGRPVAAALFAHCFTCGKDIAAARRIAGRLAAAGIAVLRFDFTGLGHSGGEFANATFTGNVADLVRAGEALRARGLEPQLLVGHSLGGAAAICAAARMPEVRAVATIGAPFDPAHVTHQFGASMQAIERDGAAEVSLAGRPFTIRRAFVDDIREARLTQALRSLRAAILILHSPVDETVGIDEASGLFLAARHPKSFVTLDDADHLLTRTADAEYAAGVIAAWAARYLDMPKTAPGPPEGVVRSVEADPGGFLQDISVGPRHALLADEPADHGGTDRGPSPYGLLAAGLAACTSMTIRLYARRKGVALEGVSVDVTHDRVHAADADAGAEGGDRTVDLFRRVIHLRGTLTADERARLLRIADRCPVHLTLERGARIETRMDAETAT